jgi:uncharacterized DUF497 family protein
MDIVWDSAKAKANYARHRVRFSEVELVFYDPSALTVEDTSASREQRFVTLGSDGLGRVLVVVYTYRGETIRVISARRASPGEVKSYEEGV